MKKTILLVDDEPKNLSYLFDHLRSLGYHVLIGDNGAEAIEQAKRISPDLILLDVFMPELDGYETCRRLKQNEKTGNIPVIFLSGLTDVHDRLMGFAAGGVDYITKPLNPDLVSARIMTHLELASLRCQLMEANRDLSIKITKRTADLEEANLALKKEIELGNQKQKEKEQLMVLLKDQIQNLNDLTGWLLQSKPNARLELKQLLGHKFLDTVDQINNDFAKLSVELERQNLLNDLEFTPVYSLRLRISQLHEFLKTMLYLASSSSAEQSKAINLANLLTYREQEILILLADGLSTSEIGNELSISEITVRTYRTRIMRKLNINHLPGLVKFALKNNLTSLD